MKNVCKLFLVFVTVSTLSAIAWAETSTGEKPEPICTAGATQEVSPQRDSQDVKADETEKPKAEKAE